MQFRFCGFQPVTLAGILNHRQGLIRFRSIIWGRSISQKDEFFNRLERIFQSEASVLLPLRMKITNERLNQSLVCFANSKLNQFSRARKYFLIQDSSLSRQSVLWTQSNEIQCWTHIEWRAKKKMSKKRIENTTAIVKDDTVQRYHRAYVRFPEASTGSVPSIDFQLHWLSFDWFTWTHSNQMYPQIFVFSSNSLCFNLTRVHTKHRFSMLTLAVNW